MQIKAEVVVNWTLGLHIRPATKIVKLLKPFASDIKFLRDGTSCNAKSVIQLLTLEAGKGDAVDIHAVGEDAEAAVEAVRLFFQTYDDEDGIIGPY